LRHFASFQHIVAAFVLLFEIANVALGDEPLVSCFSAGEARL